MHSIIFPALVGTRKIDPFWEEQKIAAESVGFKIRLAPDQNESGPLRISGEKGPSLYRGWIVKPKYYQEMSAASDNLLLNSYEDYMWSYDFPKWAGAIDTDLTPWSVVFPADDVVNLGLETIAERMTQVKFPLILKDYLKSRKHEWNDACFIKDPTDTKETIRIMSNFFQLQGRDFYGGLVFRKFLNLKKLGTHPKSGMPLPVEFRTFFLHGKPLTTTMYWNNDIPYPAGVVAPPQEWLEKVGRQMKSPFVALDIAQDENDKWWVIEVNDGGSAGYPDNLDTKEFYSLLYTGLSK